MLFQILTQTEPGEPWRVVAHGARYTDAEAQGVRARLDMLGKRSRVIPCGKPRKNKEA